MKKRDLAMLGKRLFNRHSGEFGRVTKVLPHGKTSARFVVTWEGSASKIEWEDTFGELQRHNDFVTEQYRHILPPHADRIRRMIALVDERCGGKVGYVHEHYTQLDSWVKNEADPAGFSVRDGFSLWKARMESKYVMGISLWGSGLSLSLEARYAEIDAAGGDLWAVFKPKMEALAAELEKGGQHE